jgi:hypothetical protein
MLEAMPAQGPKSMAPSPIADRPASNPLLHALMYAILAGVRDGTADLTARQVAVFLKVYLEPAKEYSPWLGNRIESLETRDDTRA